MGSGASREERIRKYCEFHNLTSLEEYNQFMAAQQMRMDERETGGNAFATVHARTAINKNNNKNNNNNMRYALRREYIRRGNEQCNWGGNEGTGFEAGGGVEVELPVEVRHQRKWDDDEVTLCMDDSVSAVNTR